MKYAVINLPPKSENVERFRSIYDAQAELLQAHVTLIFPFEFDADEITLKKHIASIAAQAQPFQVHFNAHTTSDDNYLFLTSDKQKEISALHDALYTGPLSRYLQELRPYTPHITVGNMSADSTSEMALKEAHLTDKINYYFDTIELIQIDENPQKIRYLEKYHLGVTA